MFKEGFYIKMYSFIKHNTCEELPTWTYPWIVVSRMLNRTTFCLIFFMTTGTVYGRYSKCKLDLCFYRNTWAFPFVLALRFTKKKKTSHNQRLFLEKASIYLPDRQKALGFVLETLNSISFHQKLYHVLKHTTKYKIAP